MYFEFQNNAWFEVVGWYFRPWRIRIWVAWSTVYAHSHKEAHANALDPLPLSTRDAALFFVSNTRLRNSVEPKHLRNELNIFLSIIFLPNASACVWQCFVLLSKYLNRHCRELQWQSLALEVKQMGRSITSHPLSVIVFTLPFLSLSHTYTLFLVLLSKRCCIQLKQ